MASKEQLEIIDIQVVDPSLREAIFAEVAALTSRCVDATPQAMGLVRAFSSDEIRSFANLPATSLLIAKFNDRIVGFALFHREASGYPDFMSTLAKDFAKVEGLVFGHLVAVLPEYRGAKLAIYRKLLEKGRALISTARLVFTLVRGSNLLAKGAHSKQGWHPIGVSQSVIIDSGSLGANELRFEFWVLELNGESKSAIESVREIAKQLKGSYQVSSN